MNAHRSRLKPVRLGNRSPLGLAISRRRRTGAAMVEFAMVSWVFFGVMYGLFEVGLGIIASQLLTNAAREGCRAAIIEGTTTSQVQSKISNQLSGTSLDPGQVAVAVTVQVNGSIADAATAQAGDAITVTASVSSNQVIPAPFFGAFLPAQISGVYSLRRE